VEENPVLVLAVLAQSLAVVGEEDDERPLVEAFRFQEGDERADDRIRRRDLSVVRIGGVAGGEGLRGRIRRVRLVEVQEGEGRVSGGGAPQSSSPGASGSPRRAAGPRRWPGRNREPPPGPRRNRSPMRSPSRGPARTRIRLPRSRSREPSAGRRASAALSRADS